MNRFLSAALKKSADTQSVEHSWENFRCLFSPASNMAFEGLYYVHVMNWLCNFPPENILILNSEEFYHDTPAVYEEVIKFLGLPPLDPNTIASITSNSYNARRQDQEPMPEKEQNNLRVVYKQTNKPLLRLLGWEDLDWS